MGVGFYTTGGGMSGATYDSDTDDLIDAAAGGLELDTSQSTGVASVSSGTWSIAATLTHELGGLEADISAYDGLVKISGGATSAIADASANWNTAYGWGDHASGGYAASSHAMSTHSDEDTYNISTSGSATVGSLAGPASDFLINNTVEQDIKLFAGHTDANKYLYTYGYQTGVALKYLRQGVGTDGWGVIDGELGGTLKQGGTAVAVWNNTYFEVLDDKQFLFGTDGDASIEYDEVTDNCWKFGVPASNVLAVVQKADIAQDLTIPAYSHPTLAIYGASYTDYIAAYHDETDGWIKVLDGGIKVSTDEGTNTDMSFSIIPKGTGDGILNLYQDGTNRLNIIKTADTEGIASSADLRIGLDESLRILHLMDAGDIDVDTGSTAKTHPTLTIWKNNYADRAEIDYGKFSFIDGAFAMNMDMGYPRIQTKTAEEFYATVDRAAGNLFMFTSAANIELTDTDGHQAWMYLEPKINQSSTGAWSGIHMNPIITAQGDGSTAAIGENTLADFEADSVPVWNICIKKVTFAHDSALFDASALTDSTEVFSIPANSKLISCVMKLDTQFAGVTTLKVEVGPNGGDTDGFLLPGAMDLTSDPANSHYSQHGALWDTAANNGGEYYFDGAQQIDAKATSTVENLDQTSAGSVTFYITYMVLVTTT